MLQGFKDEQLAEGSSECKLCQRHHDGRVGADEFERALKLGAGRRGVKDRNVREGEDGDDGRERGAEQVDPEHHLLSRHAVTREDLVLRRVCRAVDRKVDEEIGDANELRVCGEVAVLG